MTVTAVKASEPSEFGEMVNRVGGRPDYSVNDNLSTPSGFTGYTVNEMRVKSSQVQIYGRTAHEETNWLSVDYQFHVIGVQGCVREYVWYIQKGV